MTAVHARSSGRIITVSFDPGEELVSSLGKALAEAGVESGLISFHGELKSARLILGFRKYSRATDDFDRVSFDDSRQASGNGEVWQSTPGSTKVALWCTVGHEREVFVGDIVEATVGRGFRLGVFESVA